MICACGCGGELSPLTWRDKYLAVPRRFIAGHNIRKKWADFPSPNPSGICQCGCGESAPIATANCIKHGYLKGQPVRFIVGHNAKGKPRKPTTYPAITRSGRLLRQHVILAELALGKPLPAQAEVHHVDGNKHNNSNTNLVICEDHSYHGLLHRRARIVRAGGNPNTDAVCGRCRAPFPLTNFYIKTKTGLPDAYCKDCTRVKNAEKDARYRKAREATP